MNILLNSIVFDPAQKIGVGVYVVELIRALADEFPLQQFHILVDASRPAVAFDLPNVVLVPVSIRPRPSVRQAFQQGIIRRKLAECRADVYHLLNTAPLGRLPCPSIITIHDLQEFKVPKYGVLRGCYRRHANLHAAARASLIITVSESSRRDIVEKLGACPEKVCVTPLAPDLRFRPVDRQAAASEIHRRYALESYALAVGAINPGKNLAALIRAFSRTPPELCRHLALAGPGRPDSKLQAAIAESRVQDRIRVLNYVPDDQMPLLYAGAELLVYPSLYEGFGLPPLEAMACGAPVAASQASSIPEVVGEAAVLFDPRSVDEMAAAISQILSNPARRAHLVLEGFRHAARFSWRQTAWSTMAAYERLAGAGLPGRGALASATA